MEVCENGVLEYRHGLEVAAAVIWRFAVVVEGEAAEKVKEKGRDFG